MKTADPNERFLTTPLITIYITVFIDLIGFGMVIPILPFYANTAPYLATPFQVGLLFSIYSWMQFFCSPLLGRLSDIYGRRPILFISLLGSAVGYFVIGIAETLAMVFIGRIIGGITGANIATAQAYIADVTSKENRAKGMGLFGAMFGLGFILGPAIAGILSKYGIHVPFYSAAALSLINAVVLYFVLPESINREQSAELPVRKSRVNELIGSMREKDFGFLNLLYFLLVMSFSIMTYAFVLYTAFRYGYDAEQNGYLFAFVGLIAIMFQGAVFQRLVRLAGEMKLTVIGCLLMALGLFAIPFVGPESGGLTALLVTLALLAIGNALASPALTSLVSKISPDDKQGSSLGIMQSGASLARAIGPIIGGMLLNNALNAVDDNTVTRTFWTASAIMIVAMFTALYVMKLLKPRDL